MSYVIHTIYLITLYTVASYSPLQSNTIIKEHIEWGSVQSQRLAPYNELMDTANSKKNKQTSKEI